MLNLDEIIASVIEKATGESISRDTFHAIARRVIPLRTTISASEARMMALRHNLPEVEVYKAADQMTTTDWLDLACFIVAETQLRNSIEERVGASTQLDQFSGGQLLLSPDAGGV
jgi:hypothetical protein